MRRVLVLGVVALLGQLVEQGKAATLTFSDLSSGACGALGSSGIDTQGYHFAGNVADPGLYLCDPGVLQNNATPALINANSLSALTLTRTGGGLFSLISFSAGTRTQAYNPSAIDTLHAANGIDIVGTLFGGGTVSTSIAFNGTSFDSYGLPTAFSNLSAVTFTATGGISAEFLLNNVDVNSLLSNPNFALTATPEPGTVGLISMGLAAAALFGRKRTSRNS